MKRSLKPVAYSTLLAFAAILAINVPLAAYVWLPRITPLRALIPLAETMVLLWLVALTRGTRGTRRIVAIAVLGTAAGILLAFSLTEAFYQFYFGRQFYPRSDIPMVRGGLLLLFGDIGELADRLTPVVITLILSVASIIGALLVLAARKIITRAPRPTAGLLVITVLAFAAVLFTATPRSLAWMGVSWLRPEPLEIVEVETDAGVPDSQTYSLPGLLDRDIYVFAVEAYGYTTVSRPDLSAQVEPYRERLEQALAEKGYAVYTSYLESPVAGGYSWLAEATFLTAQWINSQEKFLALTNLPDGTVPSLTGMLHENGYYTLTLRPGTVHGSWPEGWSLYRFEESLVAHDGDFSFAGPWFSYVPITDQFTILAGERRIQELTAPGGPAEERPLLAWYQLVSSHTPFTRIPPVLEWDEIGDGSVYNERAAEIQTFANNWTGGTELDEGYVAAIGYVFDVLTGYVKDVMDASRSPIIVILGDHQPQRPIRTRDAVFSVPVHIATRDPEVAAAFAARGYERGMVGTQEPPHPGMDQFFPLFAEIALSPAETPEPGTQ